MCPPTGRPASARFLGPALVRSHSLPLGLVEPLNATMPTMERALLAHALYLLGATHAPQAQLLIGPFLHHSNPEEREEVRHAAAEITAGLEGP